VVAVADAERGVELLDTQTLAPARRMPIHGGADAITVAPDGRTAAFGTHDGSVGFADLQTGQLLRPPEPSHVNAVRDLVFSPDGRWLATTDGRIVFLWDARSRRTLAAFQGVVGVATSVRFTPDSRRLVVADARPRGPGALDELSAPHLQLLRQAIVPPLSQLTFSQDGKILFGAGPGGRLWLLDTRTWKPLGAPLPANAARMAIDPTDRLLATSSTGGAVQLWDVRAGRPLGGTLPGIARRAVLLAFVRGGSALVTVQTDGTALVWDVRPRSWTRRACAIAGRPLTRAEWHDALPDLPYSPACAARR
jgi:WD40 repeat protein